LEPTGIECVKKKALLIAAPFRSGLAFNLVEGINKIRFV
jgi:hypothetical protein